MVYFCPACLSPLPRLLSPQLKVLQARLFGSGPWAWWLMSYLFKWLPSPTLTVLKFWHCWVESKATRVWQLMIKVGDEWWKWISTVLKKNCSFANRSTTTTTITTQCDTPQNTSCHKHENKTAQHKPTKLNYIILQYTALCYTTLHKCTTPLHINLVV